MNKTIPLNREPVVGCPCGNQTWYLIVNPNKSKIPKKLIAFECTNCEYRLTCDIEMED